MEVIEQWIQERIKASDHVSVLAGEAMADCGDFLEATDNPDHSLQIETLRDYFKQIWEIRA